MPRTDRTRPETLDPGAWKIAYTVTEAAAALGVSQRTVWAATHDGRLAHRWLTARKMLIPRTALLAWFETLPEDRPA